MIPHMGAAQCNMSYNYEVHHVHAAGTGPMSAAGPTAVCSAPSFGLPYSSFFPCWNVWLQRKWASLASRGTLPDSH